MKGAAIPGLAGLLPGASLIGLLSVASIAPLAMAATTPAQQATLAFPEYPGASHPLPAWERPRLAISQTSDPPQAVIAYFARHLPAEGWRSAPHSVAEAVAAADAGAPAWLQFEHPRLGRLDLQIHAGPHPRTRQPLTMIFSQRIPPKP
ncbi:MAG: hypothetical protein VKP62_08580 [Candidatus Sericytochromatia bacterium]|nr:hypothetical protein [Candidatus Sericytochromatia bacterium]